MIPSLVVASLIAGGVITAIGYYTPFMILASILMVIGAGLISTFDIGTGHAHWMGGALFVSVGQNVFTNKLASGLASSVPGVNPAIVLSAGVKRKKSRCSKFAARKRSCKRWR
ncbi:hypothetical protein C8R46DRAFT_1029800 [Mycena filopes]|nr:hypothetical protein C8R46DRAFT_1029800 [Mycena filopes]